MVHACREALIQELRDAFLGLADAAPDGDAPARAAQFEARIRELHAALEAAGDTQGSPGAWPSPQLVSAPGSGSSEQWAIAAVRPAAALPEATAGPASPRAAPLPAQRNLNTRQLKSALKRPAAGSGSWTPARPGAQAAAPAAQQPLRPGSARPVGKLTVDGGQAPQLARPGTAPIQQEGRPQQQPQQQECSPVAHQAAPRRRWQADDGLAQYEALPAVHEEQARCKTPRPFQQGCVAQQQGLAAAGSCPESPVSSASYRLVLPQAGHQAPAASPRSQAAAVQQAHAVPQQQPLQLPVGLPRSPSSRPASASQTSSPMRRPCSAQPQTGSPSQVGAAWVSTASSPCKGWAVSWVNDSNVLETLCAVLSLCACCCVVDAQPAGAPGQRRLAGRL